MTLTPSLAGGHDLHYSRNYALDKLTVKVHYPAFKRIVL